MTDLGCRHCLPKTFSNLECSAWYCSSVPGLGAVADGPAHEFLPEFPDRFWADLGQLICGFPERLLWARRSAVARQAVEGTWVLAPERHRLSSLVRLPV